MNNFQDEDQKSIDTKSTGIGSTAKKALVGLAFIAAAAVVVDKVVELNKINTEQREHHQSHQLRQM